MKYMRQEPEHGEREESVQTDGAGQRKGTGQEAEGRQSQFRNLD